MLHVHEDRLDPKTRALRAARLAKERAVEQARRHTEKISGSIGDFWDLVDTSGGIDACHPWTGYINTSWTTYGVGEFKLDGCETTLVHRITIFLTTGSEVRRDYDVVPTCGNHLCCNESHLNVVPHNGAR